MLRDDGWGCTAGVLHTSSPSPLGRPSSTSGGSRGRTPSTGGAGNLWEQARFLLFLALKQGFSVQGFGEPVRGWGQLQEGHRGRGSASRIMVVPVAAGAAEEGLGRPESPQRRYHS